MNNEIVKGQNSSKECELEIETYLNDNWKQQRAKLHHDWLQNRYITFLKAEEELLDDPEKSADSRENSLEQLLIWEQKRAKLAKFIDNTVEALSPRQLLYVPPLNKMKHEDKEWLDPLIHSIYLEKSDIDTRVKGLSESFYEIDELVTELSSMLKGKVTVKKGYGKKLLKKVLEFSKQISELPHDVQVI